MGQLAFSVAGAVVGSFFGVPQVGWLIGSVIGGLLFPADQGGGNVTAEGPRLGDLTVTTSAYGSAIAQGFGTVRMSGNMIWAKPIEEVKNVKKTSSGGGGKGGGGGGATSTQITYEYFATFALAFSKGVADDVIRIWADGKLIFDRRGTSDDFKKQGVNFRFYSGNETQEPDSLIVADQGAQNTPAFRGLCYMVFQSLPLKDFGNRIPNITVEVSYNRIPSNTIQNTNFFTVAEGGISADIGFGNILPDLKRGRFYSRDASTLVLRRFDTRTMTENRQKSLIGTTNAKGNNVSSLLFCAVLPNGYLVVEDAGASFSIIDPDTLSIVDTFWADTGPNLTNNPIRFASTLSGRCSWIETGGGSIFFFHVSFDNSVGLLRAEGSLSYVWDSDTFGNVTEPECHGSCAGAIGADFGEGYYIVGNNYTLARTDSLRLIQVRVEDTAFGLGTTVAGLDALSSGVTENTIGTFAPGDLVPGETQLRDCKPPLYDKTDDTIIMQVEDDNNKGWLIKIDTSGNILWRTQLDPAVGARGAVMGYNHSRLEDGIIGIMSSFNGVAYRTTDGSLLFGPEAFAEEYTTSGAGWWDSNISAFIGGDQPDAQIRKFRFLRGDGSGADLADIITTMSINAGLTQSDIDVTDLVGIEVPGYIIGRQTPVRAVIEQLASVFFFDGVESDYVIKYTLRDGKSIAANIVQRDLAPLGEGDEFFREDRIQEVELPSRFTLTYMSDVNDYQQQTHSARRTLQPLAGRTMFSRNEISAEIPIVLSETLAKQAAEKALYSSWIERASLSIQVGWKFLELDPNDVVTITLDDGTIYRTRLIQTDVGANFAIDINALTEDSAQYTSTVAAAAGDGPLIQEFLSISITKLLLLDTPLLRDSHDIGRAYSQLYYFMGGYGQAGWTSGTLWRSDANTVYDTVGSVVNEMTWGAASNVLGDTNAPFQIDDTNTLEVFLNTNTDVGLSSVTELEMLNGANGAALISANGDIEVFQFQTATQNDNGAWTLSKLLRGRRGTENFTGGHAVGDVFVLLEDTTGDRLGMALEEIGVTRFYRGVTSGLVVEDADTVTKAASGNDLKPYAPVHVDSDDGTFGGDITFTWQRRTRIAGGFKLNASDGEVPLNEDTEAYDADIVSADGGRVIRSYNGLGTKTAVYLTSHQAEDFPGTFAEVTDQYLTNANFESQLTVAGESIPGWTFTQDGTCFQVKTGADGNIAGAQDGDNWLSAMEANSSEAIISQTVNLSSVAYEIESTMLDIQVTVWANSDQADTDTAAVDMVWIDVDGSTISTDTGTPLDPSDTGTWTQITESNTPPSGTRSLRIDLVADRVGGSGVPHVAFDNMQMFFDFDDPTQLGIRVYQKSAQVGRGFPSKFLTVDV